MSLHDRSGPDASAAFGAFLSALGFLTRLPVARDHDKPDFRATVWTFPLVGVVVGAIGGLVYALADALGLAPLFAASLAVMAAVLVTGAMHEDGLSDTVDGFGGGATATAKLDIMRDSRVGSFGALALVFAVLLRVGALVTLAPQGAFAVFLVLVAGEAVARAGMVRLWYELPSARLDGLGRETGSPEEQAMTMTLAIAGAIGFLLGLVAVGFVAAIVGLAATALAVLGFTRLCNGQIGGQTGDTLGAAEQIGLVAWLLAVAILA